MRVLFRELCRKRYNRYRNHGSKSALFRELCRKHYNRYRSHDPIGVLFDGKLYNREYRK